jgi:hypothetical protein
MRRQMIVMMTLSLLLVPGIILLPVSAVDIAGPDTSGSDIDIGRAATELLDDNWMVLVSPPRYQWTADRYLEEGNRCAEKCASGYQEYIHSPENAPGLESTYNQGIAFCECANKNYNKALQLTKEDDYSKQAEIFDAGSRFYASLNKNKEAGQMQDAADLARAHAAASDLFLPLSPLVALLGIIGGLLLLHCRR